MQRKIIHIGKGAVIFLFLEELRRFVLDCRGFPGNNKDGDEVGFLHLCTM
jgi:hypothetical protein